MFSRPRISDRTLALATLWFMGAGLALLLAAGLFWLQERRTLRSEEVATGMITEYVPRETPEGHVLFYPHIRFRAAGGGVHEFFAPDGTNPAPFTAGGTVHVIYPAGHPESAHMATHAVGHPVSFGLAVTGVILFDIGGFFWIAHYRRRKRQSVIQPKNPRESEH